MSQSVQYWNQLLQEFECDSDEQLATLGIPIDKHELYLAAISNAGEFEKQHYETTAALTLLYTHFHFVRYALKNDAFMMYLWARNYSENCKPGDEFDQIHQKILAYGGLYQLSHQNVDAAGMLLSAYLKLELPLNTEQMSELKQIYTTSMKDILDCIVNNKEQTKRHDPNLPKEPEQEPLFRKKKPEEGYSLAKFRSSEHFKARKAATMAQIQKYCGHLFNISDEEYKEMFGVDRPPKPESVPVQEIFLTAPRKYSLSVDIDGFGITVGQRYAAVIEAVCSAKNWSMEKVLSLVQSAIEADPTQAVHMTAWYTYAKSKLHDNVARISSYCDYDLEQMQKACNNMRHWEVDDYYGRINNSIGYKISEAALQKNKICSLLKAPDPQIEEIFSKYCEDVKRECDIIKAKADAIKAEYDRKVEVERRKERGKKILLCSGIALAVVAVAAVVLGVLL